MRSKLFTFHLVWFMQSQVVALQARVWANPYWTNQSRHFLRAFFFFVGNWLIIPQGGRKNQSRWWFRSGRPHSSWLWKGAWLAKRRRGPPAAVGERQKNGGPVTSRSKLENGTLSCLSAGKLQSRLGCKTAQIKKKIIIHEKKNGGDVEAVSVFYLN